VHPGWFFLDALRTQLLGLIVPGNAIGKAPHESLREFPSDSR
jgi:hypothetical protein